MAKPKRPEKAVRVRVQPWIDQKVADRLDVLARKLEWTRNEVAEWVLIQGTSNLEWLAKRFAAELMSAAGGVELISAKDDAEVADGE